MLDLFQFGTRIKLRKGLECTASDENDDNVRESRQCDGGTEWDVQVRKWTPCRNDKGRIPNDQSSRWIARRKRLADEARCVAERAVQVEVCRRSQSVARGASG